MLDASTLSLTAGDGARTRIHLDGAHVVSWTPAGEEADRLFVSTKSHFGPGVSVRGGIPVCFPQFGAEGPLPQHGFARVSTWTLLHSEEHADGATALLRLVDDDATRALWPFPFSAELTVAIGGDTLDVGLAVVNTGQEPFTFTAALHPYFRVQDAFACSVEGLEGAVFRDALHGREIVDPDVVPRTPLRIDGEIDRVYFDVPGPVVVRDGTRELQIENVGFTDVVVWNPGEAGVARRDDFDTGDERRMLCVEAAAVGRPVTLAPGRHWEGGQRIVAR